MKLSIEPALLRDTSAQDLIEYAVLAGMLALATVVATQTLGETIVATFFERIAGALASAISFG
jgi:Flp pilus assembly pilin Flp